MLRADKVPVGFKLPDVDSPKHSSYLYIPQILCKVSVQPAPRALRTLGA